MFVIPEIAARCARAALIGAAMASSAVAQTQYRNLDAGRPGRVEDAEAASRYSLNVDLAPFQIERIAGGPTRYRAEPDITGRFIVVAENLTQDKGWWGGGR